LSDYREHYLYKLTKEIKQELFIALTKPSNHFKHSGLKGSARERTFIKNFFEERYPRVSVAGGEIISTTGYHSSQIDIIIYDEKITPVFYQQGQDARVVPIEGVLGTVEVKSYLNSEDLIIAIQKSERIKKETARSYWNRRRQIHKYKYYNTEFDYFPIQTMIVAIDGISMSKVGEILAEAYKSIKPEHRLDFIYILQKGLIYIDFMTNKIHLIEDTDDAIFMFYALTYGRFCLADIPPIKIHDYAAPFSIYQRTLDFIEPF